MQNNDQLINLTLNSPPPRSGRTCLWHSSDVAVMFEFDSENLGVSSYIKILQWNLADTVVSVAMRPSKGRFDLEKIAGVQTELTRNEVECTYTLEQYKLLVKESAESVYFDIKPFEFRFKMPMPNPQYVMVDEEPGFKWVAPDYSVKETYWTDDEGYICKYELESGALKRIPKDIVEKLHSYYIEICQIRREALSEIAAMNEYVDKLKLSAQNLAVKKIAKGALDIRKRAWDNWKGQVKTCAIL